MQVQVAFQASQILALCSVEFCIDFASQQLLVKNTTLFACRLFCNLDTLHCSLKKREV